ncbi:uncharacterized protein FFFS_15757 [Fusarium fujikuroi]|nr:uncharacterized protein FFFS_15757 [Fusarium fujikuroi]
MHKECNVVTAANCRVWGAEVTKNLSLKLPSCSTKWGSKGGVEKLFKSWNRKAYPEYQLSFHEKESFPQQKDDTSCGLIVLEAIRCLLVFKDVPESVEPRKARADFLRMICSFDTTTISPPPSKEITNPPPSKKIKNPPPFHDDELAVIRSVQEQLEERDISTLQDLVSTQSLPDAPSLLSKFAEFKTPCSRLYLQIKQQCEQSTKDLERVRKELEEAENSLVIETTKREGANQALEMISNTSAVEQVDLSLADDGVAAVDELGSPERQAKQHFEVFWSGLAKTQQDTITKDKEASRLCFEQAYLNAKSRVQNLTKEKDCLLSKVKRWEKFCQIFEALSFLGHPAHDGH